MEKIYRILSLLGNYANGDLQEAREKPKEARYIFTSF